MSVDIAAALRHEAKTARAAAESQTNREDYRLAAIGGEATGCSTVVDGHRHGRDPLRHHPLPAPARELSDFGPLHGDEVTVALASGLTALPLLELAKRLVQPWSSVCRQHFETVNRCT
jgi:hypothetical protein